MIKKLISKIIKTKKTNFSEDKLLKQYGKIEPKQLNHINILIITDTHDSLRYEKEEQEKLQNATYDICLILGDISRSDLVEILKYIPLEKIYGLLGNHDGLETDTTNSKYKTYQVKS